MRRRYFGGDSDRQRQGDRRAGADSSSRRPTAQAEGPAAGEDRRRGSRQTSSRQSCPRCSPRTKSGSSNRCAAWVAGRARSSARPAPASTSRTSGSGTAACGCAAGIRAASACSRCTPPATTRGQAERALAAARDAQVLVSARAAGRARLRRLRPVLAGLPGRHEPGRARAVFGGDARMTTSQVPASVAERNLYVPYRMRIAKVTEEAPGVRTFRLEFVDAEEGRAVLLQGRAVRRVFRVSARASPRSASPRRRRGRATSSVRSARPAGSRPPWPTATRATSSASAARTGTRSRSSSGTARTCCSSPAGSPCRRCAA